MALYFLRYTLFGLLDTFLLRWIAQPQVTESVHQLVIGRVKLQRAEPGLAGFRKVSLFGVDITQMLIEHCVIADEGQRALHLGQGLWQQAGLKQGPGEAIDIVPIGRFKRDGLLSQREGLLDLDPRSA